MNLVHFCLTVFQELLRHFVRVIPKRSVALAVHFGLMYANRGAAPMLPASGARCALQAFIEHCAHSFTGPRPWPPAELCRPMTAGSDDLLASWLLIESSCQHL